MGEKSEAFCRAALNVAQQYAGIMVLDFDIAGFQRDQHTLDLLRRASCASPISTRALSTPRWRWAGT